MLAALAMVASVFVAPEAKAQGPTFVFTGGGWGHGVGMSQNGARNMANQGADHVAILAHYYPNTILSKVAPLDDIRVHIGDAPHVEMQSSNQIVFERQGVSIVAIPSGSITITAHDGGLQIGGAWTTATASDPIMVSFPEPVTIVNNGHRYLWGRFQLTNHNGKVRVVEKLPFEKYVAGISEMPAAWPLEALMAQAIAARTYAHEVTMHRRTSAEWAQEYDISATTVDQNYIGWDAQDGQWDLKWTAAAGATAGVQIVDNNGPIRAYYSASNGGYTETAAYVFNNDVPYTVSGPDPHDAGGHEWTSWTRSYSQASMSGWLNVYPDTAVGSLTQINVLDGAGASARIDRATVELVGTSGTKRVTGKRLMTVMNAGIFAEGGGLDRHLPSTFTTIGNGVGVGPPAPSGRYAAATVTPDPTPDADGVGDGDGESDGESGSAFPPGWTPEPGTGVAPIRGGSDSSDAADSGAADSGAADSDAADSDAADSDGDGESGSAFPPGWTPEPGTGVAPIRGGSDSSDAADSGAADSGSADSGSADSDGDGESGSAFPPGWTPEPGTGVAPIGGGSDSSDAAESGAADSGSADSGSADSDGDGESGSAFPPGWTPEPGTGVAPVPVAKTATSTATRTDTETVGGTGGGLAFPADWTPEPGTGRAPVPIAAPAEQADAGWGGSVVLVTRSEWTSESSAKFRVVDPYTEFSDAERSRVQQLQTQAALALFAPYDIDGIVESLGSRPVHAACTATDKGITCVPLGVLQQHQADKDT